MSEQTSSSEGKFNTRIRLFMVFVGREDATEDALVAELTRASVLTTRTQVMTHAVLVLAQNREQARFLAQAVTPSPELCPTVVVHPEWKPHDRTRDEHPAFPVMSAETVHLGIWLPPPDILAAWGVPVLGWDRCPVCCRTRREEEINDPHQPCTYAPDMDFVHMFSEAADA